MEQVEERETTGEIESAFEDTKNSLLNLITVLKKGGCKDVYLENQKMVTTSYLYMSRALFHEFCKKDSPEDMPTFEEYSLADEPNPDSILTQSGNDGSTDVSTSTSSSSSGTDNDETHWSHRLISRVRDSMQSIYSTISTIVHEETSYESESESTIPPFVTCPGDHFSQKLGEMREDFLRLIDDEWNPRKPLIMQNKRTIVEKICSTTKIIHFTEENVKTTTMSVWRDVLPVLNLRKNQEKEVIAYFVGLFRRKGYFRTVVECMIKLHKELCEVCNK